MFLFHAMLHLDNINIPFLSTYRVRNMLLNTTFNNISVTSWQEVLLVEENGIPGETTNLPQVTDKLCYIMLY